MTRETLWLIVGFAGQVVFTGRFVLQWLYSEFKKRSVLPAAPCCWSTPSTARTRYSSSASRSAWWSTCATCS